MKQVSFTKPVEFHSGIIGLTDKQASVRFGQLKPVKKGRYEVIKTVQFKAGEKIALFEIPKSYRHLLDPESESELAEAEKEAIEANVKAEMEAEEKAKAEEAAETETEAKGKGSAKGPKAEDQTPKTKHP